MNQTRLALDPGSPAAPLPGAPVLPEDPGEATGVDVKNYGRGSSTKRAGRNRIPCNPCLERWLKDKKPSILCYKTAGKYAIPEPHLQDMTLRAGWAGKGFRCNICNCDSLTCKVLSAGSPAEWHARAAGFHAWGYKARANNPQAQVS